MSQLSFIRFQLFKKKASAVKLEQTYALMTEAIKLVSLDFDGNGMNSWKCEENGNYWGTRCFGLIFDKMKLTKRFPIAGSKDKVMCYEEGKSYRLVPKALGMVQRIV